MDWGHHLSAELPYDSLAGNEPSLDPQAFLDDYMFTDKMFFSHSNPAVYFIMAQSLQVMIAMAKVDSNRVGHEMT